MQRLLSSAPLWTVASAPRSTLLSHLWSWPLRNQSPIQVTFRILLPSRHSITNSPRLSPQSLSLGSQTIAQVSGSHLSILVCFCPAAPDQLRVTDCRASVDDNRASSPCWDGGGEWTKKSQDFTMLCRFSNI